MDAEKELAPLEHDLEVSEKGMYVIPISVIAAMSPEDYYSLNDKFNQLVAEYPDFEFMQEDIPLGQGIKISWRRIWNRNEVDSISQ